MDNKILKGIALILFGMLICIAGAEINSTVLRSFTDFPFSLTGLVTGIIGIVMIFSKKAEEKKK